MESICTEGFLVLNFGGSIFQNPVSDDLESYRSSVGGLEKNFVCCCVGSTAEC